MTRTKRYVISKHIPVERKTKKYVISPRAGPHGKEQCIPLGVVVRDILKLADTGRDTKRILGKREVFVDGRARQDNAYPVGVMDVVSLPKTKKNYRMLPKKGKLTLLETTSERSKFKLSKIIGKTTLSGGTVQLNLHDGRNIRVPVKDSKKPVEDVYATGDTLKVSVPDQKIIGHYPFKQGAVAMIIDGSHAGLVGNVKEVVSTRDMQRAHAVLSTDGKETTTVKDYVFVIGKEKAEILVE